MPMLPLSQVDFEACSPDQRLPESRLHQTVKVESVAGAPVRAAWGSTPPSLDVTEKEPG